MGMLWHAFLVLLLLVLVAVALGRRRVVAGGRSEKSLATKGVVFRGVVDTETYPGSVPHTFTTPSRWQALVESRGDNPAALAYGYRGKEPYIAEKVPGGFTLLKGRGIVHTFRAEDFRRRGARVYPVDVEIIEDVYDELRQFTNLRMVAYEG